LILSPVIFFNDGTIFKAPADPDLFAKELALVSGEDPERVSKYLSDTESLYNLSSPIFLFSSFHRHSKLFTRNNLGVLTGMIKFNPFLSMHALNQKNFESEYTIQLFDRYATYNGSDPYKAPATLNMIAHLEHNLGAFFPEGGMYKIAEHLYQLALDKGVDFHFNTQVEEIIMKDRKASGVRANGKINNGDLVVSGGDIFRTYKQLLPNSRTPKSVMKPKLSASAMIFYLGVNRTFNQLDLHNIFFSGNYKAEFKALSPKGKSIPFEDPTVYIYNSSLLNKKDAPPGCSNLFVMINTAYNRGEDWNEMSKTARKHIFNKLKSHGIDLDSNIEFEDVATPSTIEQMTLSTAGALYGNSSNSAMSAFNRHPNFSRRIKNLFFVGGSVHPGGGIPLCLASAKIVEEEVKLYLNRP